MLGKFEELILISAIRVGVDATASEIHDVLCAKVGKEKSFAAVWTTLNRMVSKDYLTVTTKPRENGKQRKHFTVTGEGHRVLNESLVATKSLLKGSGLKPTYSVVQSDVGGIDG